MDTPLLSPSEQRAFLERYPPKPAIYYADLLLSAGFGWAAFFGGWLSNGPVVFGLDLVASVLLLRAAYFLHEIAHRTAEDLPGFEIIWHGIIGLPLGLPSLLIYGHTYHHRPTTYGTDLDPEYERIADWSIPRLVLTGLSPVLLPPLLPLRWAIIAPLSAVLPPLRRLVVAKMSTLDVNPRFNRPAPVGRERSAWLVQEPLACAVMWGYAYAWWVGVLPTSLLLHTWLILAVALLLNQLRTFVSHFFENESLQSLSKTEQVLDSVTIESPPIVSDAFWPLGTKYHAMHHLLQTLPYHSLGTAHRELVATLPASHPYRSTIVRGFFASMSLLWLRRGRPKTQLSRPRTA